MRLNGRYPYDRIRAGEGVRGSRSMILWGAASGLKWSLKLSLKLNLELSSPLVTVLGVVSPVGVSPKGRRLFGDGPTAFRRNADGFSAIFRCLFGERPMGGWSIPRFAIDCTLCTCTTDLIWLKKARKFWFLHAECFCCMDFMTNFAVSKGNKSSHEREGFQERQHDFN